MQTYIHLVNFTDEGVRNVAESPDRLEAAEELAGSLGGEFSAFYLTFGQYDIVAITQFPDDEAATTFSLNVTSKGAVTAETLKALSEDTYRDVVGDVA